MKTLPLPKGTRKLGHADAAEDGESGDGEAAILTRILDAAFEAFREKGYAATSTLEIATRARVSKRELYAARRQQAGDADRLHQRARKRLQAPTDLPLPRDRETLADTDGLRHAAAA